MNRNVHQGSYGEAFVSVLASAAGLMVSRPHLDLDGVDWMIAHPGPYGTVRSPKIEVQVKTWSKAVEADAHWQERLDVAHYNALAGPGFMVPRFLVAVIVPSSSSDYVRCSRASMTLRHAGYWLSLADHDVLPTDDGHSKTVQVHVPKRNLLTAERLVALVGGDLEGASS